MFWNHEGYADPTAGAAIAHITRDERRKKRRFHDKEAQASIHPKTAARQKSKKRHYNERVENAKWIKAISNAQKQIRDQEAEHGQ